MIDKEAIRTYREQIHRELQRIAGERIQEAEKMLAELSDEELLFGMPFNTPEEVASTILEIH